VKTKKMRTSGKTLLLIVVSLVSIVILLGIVGSVVFSPVRETLKSSSPIPESIPETTDNNSYTELLRFVERLMSYSWAPFGETTILPGELPSDLPVEVPIPKDAEIIGSSVHPDIKYKHVEIILDVPEEPNEVIEFYRNSLEKAGWNEKEGFYLPEGGFAPIPSMPESATFCRYEREGPSLTITAYTPDGEKPADVRLHLDTDPKTAICRERFGPQGTDRIEEIIPLLKPPEGAIQRGGGSGGGGDQWESDATLETELSVREIGTHYRNQLMAAGWELKEEGSNGSIAWSSWSFTDEFADHWSGILLVSELGQENLRFVYLMVHL
jgi:hypothetical protein